MKKGTQVSEKIPAANRQYKDTVFRMLFSEKENLLSLYNAVTGKAYQNADDLKIVTLENAIYMGMKNDLAFMLETNIYLYEHQSTLNPNIPLRELMEQCQTLKEYAIYVARVRKYTSEMNLNDAVARAIDECIKEGILVEFLRKNRSEVKMVSILEYDKEWEEKKLRKAEYEAGKSDGIEIAEERMIHNMIKLDFPIEKIAEVTGKSPLEIEQYLQSNRQ